MGGIALPRGELLAWEMSAAWHWQSRWGKVGTADSGTKSSLVTRQWADSFIEQRIALASVAWKGDGGKGVKP
jgi:hypothetical protein